MHGITEVTQDFYGSSSSKKPFNSLEGLLFADMPEWKQWHILRNGEFPILKVFLIDNCPKLSLKTPIQLSSLKGFEVIGSPKVGVVYEGMKEIEELDISDCNSLTSFPFSILPTTLKTIGISDCRKLKLEQPVGEMSMFLEKLTLRKCDCIDDISPEFLPRARTLNVSDCHNLSRFLIPTATETLFIGSCKKVEKLSAACGGTQMTSLDIERCFKLKWLPERMQELLPSLKELRLSYCPEIESFPQGGLPFNLQFLSIFHCMKLVNGRKEWRLQRLPCLTELAISHDGSDKEILAGENWELPSSLQTLIIHDLKTLSNQVLKSLTSLSMLHFSGHHELHSLGLWHLTSLRCLHIINCPNLQSLSESALPPSLSQLEISGCHNLQLLSESTLPSSLSELTIVDCPKLKSLPVKGMPSSLSKLSIHNCPLVRPLLEFDKGEYWPNIAQIPIIDIDKECL